MKMINVKHDVIAFDACIIDELKESVFNSSTHYVLKCAEKMGGFIAGGFATKFASLYTTIEKCSAFILMNEYISNKCAMTFDEFVRYKIYHKANYGDIDVYFPTIEAATQFTLIVMEYCNHNVNSKIVVEESPASCGYNIYCFGKYGTQMIQAITRYVGSPEEVVETFDIYNACCIIVGKNLMIPIGFAKLLKDRKISVQSWEHPWVLGRIIKWIHKHELTQGLTDDSLDSFNDYIAKMLDNVRNGNVTFITKSVEPLIKNVSLKNLLLLSIYDNNDQKYSFSMQNLMSVSMREFNRRLAESIKKGHL